MQTRIEIINNKALDFQNGATTKLHLCCTSSYPVVFCLSSGNSHDTTEGKKLIESICSKNSNYLLLDRPYKDARNLVLTKTHGFCTVVSPKKNRKPPQVYDKQLCKQCNNIERYFFRLKRFRKVFTCYHKLDSIFISTVSLTFIFDLLFMETSSN